MLPACNSTTGMNIGFPDVCVTPIGPIPTPIPYVNMALDAMAVPFAPNVLVSFTPAHNMGSIAPITLGDQPGVLSPFMGPGGTTVGNPTVLVNALPAKNLLCPTEGNDFINPLGAAVVPCITNVFYSRAGAPAEGPIDGEALAQLAATRSGDPGELHEEVRGVLVVRVSVLDAGLRGRLFAEVEGKTICALVVDLRSCPGGELEAAIGLAGDFLREGSVIATVVDADGDATTHRAPPGAVYEMPLAILVGPATASAAELFAGALQCHGRAVIVGAQTHGKGSAQAVVVGDANGAAHYATVATVVLPDGTEIGGRGVFPDLDPGCFHGTG